MARQQVLTRHPEPPVIMSILDESVLYREIEHTAMRAQLERLASLAQLPHITIQILPMRCGPGGLNSTFIMLELTELDASPALAYTDGLIQGNYFTAPDAVRRFRNTLTHLRIASEKPAQSLEIINRRVEELA